MSDATWAEFRMSRRKAEERLLDLLRKGEVEARVDERIIPPWWFKRVKLVSVSGPNRIVFKRHRDKPHILASDGTNAIASSWEVEEPRFEPETGPAAPGSAHKDQSEGAIYHSGAAGRPTSMHLIVPEARRRHDAGDKVQSISDFAKQLEEWLKRTHPDAVVLSWKTIFANKEVKRLARSMTPPIGIAQNSARNPA